MASFASWLRWSLLERLELPRVPARSPSSADRTRAREDYIGTRWRHEPHRGPPPLPLTKSPSVRCPWKPVRLTFGELRAISALYVQSSCCSSYQKLFITTAAVRNVPEHSKQCLPRSVHACFITCFTYFWLIYFQTLERDQQFYSIPTVSNLHCMQILSFYGRML